MSTAVLVGRRRVRVTVSSQDEGQSYGQGGAAGWVIEYLARRTESAWESRGRPIVLRDVVAAAGRSVAGSARKTGSRGSSKTASSSKSSQLKSLEAEARSAGTGSATRKRRSCEARCASAARRDCTCAETSAALARRAPRKRTPHGVVSTWRAEKTWGLVVGVVVGLGFGLRLGLGLGLGVGLGSGTG